MTLNKVLFALPFIFVGGGHLQSDLYLLGIGIALCPISAVWITIRYLRQGTK